MTLHRLARLLAVIPLVCLLSCALLTLLLHTLAMVVGWLLANLFRRAAHDTNSLLGWMRGA